MSEQVLKVETDDENRRRSFFHRNRDLLKKLIINTHGKAYVKPSAAKVARLRSNGKLLVARKISGITVRHVDKERLDTAAKAAIRKGKELSKKSQKESAKAN